MLRRRISEFLRKEREQPLFEPLPDLVAIELVQWLAGRGPRTLHHTTKRQSGPALAIFHESWALLLSGQEIVCMPDDRCQQ